MNKKMTLLSALLCFLIIAVSFATVSSMKNTEEKKTSPLFAVRTNKVINLKAIIQNSNFLKNDGKLFLINKIVNSIQVESKNMLNKKIDPSYVAIGTCISGCSWPCEGNEVREFLGHKAPTCGSKSCTWSTGYCPSFNDDCQ